MSVSTPLSVLLGLISTFGQIRIPNHIITYILPNIFTEGFHMTWKNEDIYLVFSLFLGHSKTSDDNFSISQPNSQVCQGQKLDPMSSQVLQFT